MDISTEAIFNMNPQLVIMSNSTSTTSVTNTIDQLKKAGIAVYLDTSNTPDRVTQIVNNFGKILGNQTMANTINSDIQYYSNLVQQRIQNATATRYLAPMGYGGWNCYGSNSQVAKLMTACGGVNLFTNNSGLITPEAAAQLNPDVIIVMCTGITNNVTAYQSSIADITSRVAFSQSNAILKNRVYCYNYWLSGGIEYCVGELCFAKWLHPELFTDIDPGAIYIQLIQKYFGVTPTGVYYYPY
jgi:iron complex transport system substrate-binding protein